MKKANKKKVIISIAIVLIIIVAVIIIRNITLDKEGTTVDTPKYDESGFLQFESEIDMNNTENSEIRKDGMKINTSEKIAKGIEFNDTTIKNITIEASGEMSVFNAEVENNLGKDIEGYIIYITFLDKKGNEIATVETLFPDILDGEIGFITATTPKDIATAYDIKIERQKI